MAQRGPIPATDADFNEYFERVVPYLDANKARLGVSNTALADLQSLFTQWNDIYPKSQNPDLRTSAITAEKNQLREQISDLLREIYRDIPESALTVSDRETLSLKLRDTEPTPSPVPDHAPDITIAEIRHLSHELRLTDPENPHTQAKPKGVAEIEVFRFISPEKPQPTPPAPPTDISQYRFVGNATRFLYTVEYTLSDVGKTVWYIARYVNTRGQPGPWSNAVNAAVA